MDLNFQVKPRGDQLVAAYSCPCGCNPRLSYARGSDETIDGCCCGNEFSVGPTESGQLRADDRFWLKVDEFDAPWGERLRATWRLARETDEQADQHGDGHHEHGQHEEGAESHGSSVDPVCGMQVDLATARASGLVVEHEGAEYAFCGKGCKLEFADSPARFLDPSYVPSM